MSRKVPRLRWSFILAFTTIVHLGFVAKLGWEGLHLFKNSDSKLEKRYQDQIDPPLPPIHIVFTSSASYVTGLLALINSTLVNASPSTRTRLQFHIVSSDSAEAGQVIELLDERFGEQLEGRLTPYGLAETADERLEHVKVWAGYRSESLSKPIVFARFLVPDLLAKDIDRVIYLDQDVLVLQDLAELWDIDLEGYPVAAARLCRMSALWRKQFVMNKNPLIEGGFSHDTCTLNNGVLVYDLGAWRSSSPSFTDQLFHWTRLNSEDKLYSLGSQPPFNLVFYRNYKVLDDKWNLMDIAGLREETDHGRGQPWTRSRDEVASSAVLHWNGAVKPWMCNGEGYYSELWTAYFPDYKDFIADPDEVNELCETLVITQPHDPPAVEQFTVVIVSFMRVDTVIKIVQHLQRSPYVREIIVAWNNLDKPCPAELESFPWVRCFQQAENLVSNRFLVWPNVTTEAVLHYDDDLIAPLEDLEAAFQIWRRHQDQILGFEPRVIVCDPEDDEDETPSDGAHLPIVMGSELRKRSHKLTGCQYRFKLSSGYLDVVIGKLFFISRTFMRAYFQNAALLALSNSAPCEDIGMNFLAAHLSLPDPASSPPPRAPLLFKSNLTEIHSKLYHGLSQGISSTVWRGKRHDCVQELVGIFGAKPGEQRSFFERDERYEWESDL
ncbi:hypothetical protein RQP46_006721 [Phenoliferia psychrophenolica]